MQIKLLYCKRIKEKFNGRRRTDFKCLGKYRSNGITEKEKTLAIIKPDGLYGNYTENIKKAILDSGFTILKEMTIQLDEDAAMGFYAEHSSKGFFSSLVKYMTRYPLNPWR